jgi:hypothetical protein
MAYVYRHIRKDLNVPFYIGIGLKEGTRYVRAHNKANRNKMWLGVVKKAGYDTDILIEGISLEEAYEKEKEFIALYKRKVHGGTLVNLTDGGDGTSGLFVSEETRAKQRAAKIGKPAFNKGVKMSPEACAKMSRAKKGKRPHNFGKPMAPESIEKYKKSMQGKHRSGPSHHAWGKKMSPEQVEKMRIGRKGDDISQLFTPEARAKSRANRQYYYDSLKKPILQFNAHNVLVGEYESAKAAHEENKLPKSSICKCAMGLMKTCGGYTWRYKNPQV